MRNILIVGASSGIGKQVALQLSAENRVYATYKSTNVSNYQNVSFHFLDVENPDVNLDFLPEVLHGFVYCPGTILLKPFSRLHLSDFESLSFCSLPLQ